MTGATKNREPQKTGLKSLFGSRKEDVEKQGRLVTVKEEKRRLRRVVKAKPMSRKHMSEAFKARSLTEEDLNITEKVIERVAAPVSVPRRAAPVRTFTCFQCGAQVPVSADRCPRCKSWYIKDLDEAEVDELLRVEALNESFLDDSPQREGAPIVHFDAETGVMHFLREDHGEPDFQFECAHCGTLVGLEVDRCPICGTKAEIGDTGLVGVFEGMEFDSSPMTEADCPYCGEHASLDSGRCHACGNEVESADPKDPNKLVRPVLRAGNVVFLHLDIMTGEINFVQRSQKKVGYDQVSVQLDGIGANDFNEDWSSLTRI